MAGNSGRLEGKVAVITGNVEENGHATATADTLAHLTPGFAPMQARQELAEAYAFYQALTQMIRLCLTGNFDRNDVPPGLADLLLAVTGLPDFGVLEAHLKDTAATVRGHFDRLLPASKKKRSGRDL